jgi:hypothetical protein
MNCGPRKKPYKALGRLKNGNRPGDPSAAPRCGARTRRGTSCEAPALRGKRRCRLHRGLSTGPKTAAGLARIQVANTKHGRYSAEYRVVRRAIRDLQRKAAQNAVANPDISERILELVGENSARSRNHPLVCKRRVGAEAVGASGKAIGRT